MLSRRAAGLCAPCSPCCIGAVRACPRGQVRSHWDWQLWASQSRGRCCIQEAWIHQARDRERDGMACQPLQVHPGQGQRDWEGNFGRRSGYVSMACLRLKPLPLIPAWVRARPCPSALHRYEEEECFSLSPPHLGSGACSLCGSGAVEACLLHQLRRRAAGFLRSDKMAALFTKVGKTCPVAGEICHKVQELQQQVEGR